MNCMSFPLQQGLQQEFRVCYAINTIRDFHYNKDYNGVCLAGKSGNTVRDFRYNKEKTKRLTGKLPVALLK